MNTFTTAHATNMKLAIIILIIMAFAGTIEMQAIDDYEQIAVELDSPTYPGELP